ncbi:putative flavin-containing monoamine oxidase aofH [Phaeosphaeria sp. MPI-PUGE-AT-0046c]|nr:putative flavin-containing monoamine oxidase aofH [Phaeosphaeria sp. MPI-PUGE-AT-0046c]
MGKSTSTSVLVIGGGMAGLTAACELHERGVDIIILEAAHRLGGRVESVITRSCSRVDIGGAWIGHDHHRLRSLATQAQSTVYKSPPSGLPLIIHNNRRIPIYSPAILLTGIIIAFFDLLCRVGAPRKWNHVSIERAVSTVAPMATTRRLLEAICTLSTTAELPNCSIYAFAQAVPFAGGLNAMLSGQGGAQDALVEDSIGSIIDMMADRLGPSRIRTGMNVMNIDQDHNEVVVRTISGGEFRSARVVVTVPPPMLKSIAFHPHLSSKLQSSNKIHKWVWYTKQSPYSTSHSGRGSLAGNSSRIKLLLGPLAQFLGPQVLEPLEWHEKAWHQDELCGGGYMALPFIGTEEGFLPMPHEPVGRIHWAGTETAQDHPGYIEGAIQSGQRVAKEIEVELDI